MNALPRVYNDTDLLIWVGQAYPTVDSYIEEARRQGCSRRLPGLFHWIEPGKTRVFLVHKDRSNDDAYGSLFGYYTINSLHVVYDDITIGRGSSIHRYRPVLRSNVKPPQNQKELEEYIFTKKIVLVRRIQGEKVESSDLPGDLIKDWVEDWLKDQFKDAIKNTLHEHGIRHIPWSMEPDNLERLCGGASSMGSGRFPGTYASDEIGDWYLDQILNWLLGEDEPREEYFWEEVVEEKVKIIKRRKHKRAEPGSSRSGRITIDEIHQRSGHPSQDISGLVVFEKPYPLYFHPPQASFRGIQRIDGDSLLLKVGLPKYILPRPFSPTLLIKELAKIPRR